MCGAEFPPCWLFGRRQPSTGAYRTFCGANRGLQEGSHQGVLPRTSAANVLFLAVSHSRPPPLQKTLQHQQVGLVQSPMGHCPFPLCPDVHTILCVLSKSGVCFSSPVEVLQTNPASLQRLILWEFLLPWPDPQVRKPDVGLRTFTPVGRLLWYNCSPVCESPTQRYWDLILL